MHESKDQTRDKIAHANVKYGFQRNKRHMLGKTNSFVKKKQSQDDLDIF
jgi:hypothetical protein